MTRHIRSGRLREWLNSIGEGSIASFLEPLEKEDWKVYLQAAGIFCENRKSAKKDFSLVVGYENVKKMLLTIERYPVEFKELSRKYGKRSGGAILLYGPPGCGKTHVACALAGESSKVFIRKAASEFFSVGRISAMLKAFKKIRNLLLFIDEMELLGVNRDFEGMNSRALTNEMLCLMDDKELTGSGVTLIGATNSPWMLDPSILRSGRFNDCIYIGLPDREERVELLKFYSKELPLDGVEFGSIADRTARYSCSDMEALCAAAASVPWGEAITSGKERRVEMRDFEHALKAIPSTATDWLKSASQVMFSETFRVKFGPMVREIEEYKRAGFK